MAKVMFGAPALVLARIVRPVVEAGTVTVIDAVALPLSASADPPEALRSLTMRPALEGDTTIRSLSVTVVDDDVAAIAALATAADLTTAAPRRSPRGSAVGAGGALSTDIALDSEAVAGCGVVAGGGDATATDWCDDWCDDS